MNASFRESLLVDGIIRWGDEQLSCTVRAVKVSIPKLDVWEYVKADIAQAPLALPDGQYEVQFEGRRMTVTKLGGSWVPGMA